MNSGKVIKKSSNLVSYLKNNTRKHLSHFCTEDLKNLTKNLKSDFIN